MNDSEQGSQAARDSAVVVFSSDETPDVASSLMLRRLEPLETAARWQQATQYLRTLVVGGAHQSLSLRRYSYGPRVVIPRHRHSTDEIYYLLAGTVHMDGRVLAAGDGFASRSGDVYSYVTGDEGADILKIRASEHYTTEFLDDATGAVSHRPPRSP